MTTIIARSCGFHRTYALRYEPHARLTRQADKLAGTVQKTTPMAEMPSFVSLRC